MSDRIAVMLDGHVEQLADPDSIYDQPASAFVAGFIGQHNFLRGSAKGDGHELDKSDGCTVLAARRADDVVAGEPAIAAVRPEAITLTRRRPGRAVNVVDGTARGHLAPRRRDPVRRARHVPAARSSAASPRHEAPSWTPGQPVWCRWAARRVPSSSRPARRPGDADRSRGRGGRGLSPRRHGTSARSSTHVVQQEETHHGRRTIPHPRRPATSQRIAGALTRRRLPRWAPGLGAASIGLPGGLRRRRRQRGRASTTAAHGNHDGGGEAPRPRGSVPTSIDTEATRSTSTPGPSTTTRT